MNKILIFLIAALYVSPVMCDQKGNELTSSDIDVVSRIDFLEKKLISEDVPSVIHVSGYDGSVPSSFIVSSGFYSDGLSVLQLVAFLEKSLIMFKKVSHKEEAIESKSREEKIQIVRGCLTKIDEILYLQFRLLIRSISITGTINPQDWRQYHLDQSANSVSYSDDYTQTQLINSFTKIFNFGEEDNPLKCSVRRIMISIFRARHANSLDYTQKREFLSQMLESHKRQINRDYGNNSSTAKERPTKEEIAGCIDLLNTIVIERVQAFPVKKVAAWLFGTGVTAVASYIVYLIICKIVSSPKLEHKVPDSADALLRQLTSGEKGSFTKILDHIVEDRIKKGLSMFEIGIPKSADDILKQLTGKEKGSFTKILDHIVEDRIKNGLSMFEIGIPQSADDILKQLTSKEKGSFTKLLDHIVEERLKKGLPMLEIGIPRSADDLLKQFTNEKKGSFTKILDHISEDLDQNKKDGKERPMFTVGLSQNQMSFVNRTIEKITVTSVLVGMIFCAMWFATH